MGRSLSPKERAKIIYKRFKACGFNNILYIQKFCPDKSDFSGYEEFILNINLYNKFFGYIVRIEL